MACGRFEILENHSRHPTGRIQSWLLAILGRADLTGQIRGPSVGGWGSLPSPRCRGSPVISTSPVFAPPFPFGQRPGIGHTAVLACATLGTTGGEVGHRANDAAWNRGSLGCGRKRPGAKRGISDSPESHPHAITTPDSVAQEARQLPDTHWSPEQQGAWDWRGSIASPPQVWPSDRHAVLSLSLQPDRHLGPVESPHPFAAGDIAATPSSRTTGKMRLVSLFMALGSVEVRAIIGLRRQAAASWRPFYEP